jgi:phenylalanyl-tRNA synthetase beta chain
MNVSTKWLSTYVDLSGVTPQQLAERLTLAGLEVEGVEPIAHGTDLVIGEVLTCEPMPQSDHLSLTTVNTGSNVLPIVCGAPNVAAGQRVIVAQNGSVLPQITIKKTSIKGHESNGMICSLLELGVDAKYLSDDQKSGIEVLGPDAPIGGDPLAYLGLDDTILDVKLTPNRSDCNALWSLALEVGALLDRPVHLPEAIRFTEKKSTLEVGSETSKCPVFIGKVIGQLSVGPSPMWLKRALNAVGIKSINNVVDISNYVMIETGQPLHFYDASKLAKMEITVKDHLRGIVKTLDESEIHLHHDDIVITCNGHPIGLAGIMGGDDSKIDESTTAIVIEAAQFSPAQIRHTSRRVNLMTEASLRFQKGLDPMAAAKAVERSTALLVELAKATALEETVVYGQPDASNIHVSVTAEHVRTLLGTPVSTATILDIFTRLRFNPVQTNDGIDCTIPSYRLDIRVAQDLIEEVGRFVGYGDLKGTLPVMPMTVGGYDARQTLRNRIRSLCVGFGMHEVITYTLVHHTKTQQGVHPIPDPQPLISPLSDERQYIRNSLLPSVLESVAYNQAHKQSDFQLFEVSALTHPKTNEERVVLIQAGKQSLSRWQQEERAYDFYSLKGVVEVMLEELGFSSQRLHWIPVSDHPFFHPTQSVKVVLDHTELGILGKQHPLAAKALGMEPVLMAELNLEPLLKAKTAKIKFTAINKSPVVVRDLALLVDRHVTGDQIESTIAEAAKNVLLGIEIFDVYTGDRIDADKQSVALTLRLQGEQTLTDVEIAQTMSAITEALQRKLNAILRG